MTTAVSTIAAGSLETVLIGGDLSKLQPAERVMYYKAVCESVGLNPLTKPFEYITLNGKLTLYARRDCTDQLRNLNKISIEIRSREVVEDCYIVTARASNPTRQDESIGAVPIGGLKGEARANAMMKAETKAKRRVTLSICGLGMLDETEVDSIPSARITPTSGAADNVTPEEQEKIKALADKVVEWINAGSIGDAYLEIENAALENEQKIYLWTMLDSKQRSALKKEAARVKAALAPPIEAEPVAQSGQIDERKISDAQRKRLEARISELKLDRNGVKSYAKTIWGVDHFADLHPEDYKMLDEWLPNLPQVDSFAADYAATEAKI